MADGRGRRVLGSPFGFFAQGRPLRSKSESYYSIPIPRPRNDSQGSQVLDEASPLLSNGTLTLTDVNNFKDEVSLNKENAHTLHFGSQTAPNIGGTATPKIQRKLSSIAEDNLEPPPPNQRRMTSLDQVPLFASLATGSNLEESLNILNLTPAEVNERLQEVSDLINRLEDTAALLRQHLHATKHAFDSRVESDGDPSSKMHIPKVLRYHLPIVAVIQLVCVTILAGYDHWLLKTGKPYTILADTIMVILQLLIVIQVVLATVELSRKLLKYGVPGSFLAQTYFSTVLAFAGIYFMIYRFDRASWDVASGMGEGGAAFSEFIRMLYLSVSSATLCGAANIQPAVWYTILLVCMQSLINFVYFASILAQTIGNYNSYTVHVQRSESLSRLTNSVSIQNVS